MTKGQSSVWCNLYAHACQHLLHPLGCFARPLLLFSCSVMSDCLQSHGLQHARFPVLQHHPSLLKLMSIESVVTSNHLILCHPLLFLPSISPSIKVSSKELAFPIRWPKYWSFSIHPSNEYSGLISFRID